MTDWYSANIEIISAIFSCVHHAPYVANIAEEQMRNESLNSSGSARTVALEVVPTQNNWKIVEKASSLKQNFRWRLVRALPHVRTALGSNNI